LITILLADDHEIFCQGLNMLLSAQLDFKVVGQASDGPQAIQMAERLRPNIVVVDMLMPSLSGLEVTSQIRQRLPDTRVIVLSMHDDESYVVTALKNGASGYVLKDSSAADLVQAVRATSAGKRFLSPSLTERAIQAYINQGLSKSEGEAAEYSRLTNREREVMHLSIKGMSAGEIGRYLSISTRTVETHRAHLMHKLGLHSQEELLAYSIKHNIQP
jgi:two-component system, NarL family, response regulator NreC